MKVTLTNASGAATASSSAVTIAWENYPGATSYNLYWANTLDFANTSKISGISAPSYNLSLANPQGDYYFFLTGIIAGEEKRISGNFMSLSQNGVRLNICEPFDIIYNWAKSKSSPLKINALSTNNSFPVSSFTASVSLSQPLTYGGVWIFVQRTEPLPDGNTAIFDSIGFWYAYYNFSNPGKSAVRYRITLNPWTIISNYEAIADPGQVKGSSTGITYTSPVSTLPGIYRIQGAGNHNPGDYPIPSTVAANINGQIVSSSTDYTTSGPMIQFTLTAANQKLLNKVDVSPSRAIAYLHPTPLPASFAATAKYSDGSSQNVTTDPSTQWAITSAIANINAGLATPLKPGVASVTATYSGVTSAPAASLYVKCANYPDYKQTSYNSIFYTYDHTDKYPPLATIKQRGCALTAMADIATAAGYTVTPDQLNIAMKNNGGFTKRIVRWDFLDGYTHGKVTYDPMSWLVDPPFIVPLPAGLIDPHLNQCKAVIAAVKNINDGLLNHYVLVTEKTDMTYQINDPYGLHTTLDGYYGQIYGYTLYNFN